MAGISLGELVKLFNASFPILPGSPLGEPDQALRQFYAEEIGVIQMVRNSGVAG